MEESRSGKRLCREPAAQEMEEGSSAMEAAGNDSFWASQAQAEPEQAPGSATRPSAAASGEGGGQAAGGMDSTPLAAVMPALFEVLTRLLIADRSIRATWR